MVHLLAKWFLKDYEHFSSPNVKHAYTKLCSGLGVAINTILFFAKLLCGSISGSTAIIADAFNNLADAATAIISFFGFILAGIGAGRHHPFGHGRYEWIMSSLSSLAVIGMGISLTGNSIQAIHNPQTVTFELLTAIVLFLSILAKFYIFCYNRKFSKKVGSSALAATAADSISDMLSTTAILISLAVQTLTGLAIDGWCGLLVSGFIIFSGLKSAAETIERLLGQSPDPEIIDKIRAVTDTFPHIHCVSDLIIHDYGLGHFVISMHIAGTKESSSMELNEIAHEISYRLYSEFRCDTTIQIDTLDHSEETTAAVTSAVNRTLAQIVPPVILNDLRVVCAGECLDVGLTIAISKWQQKNEGEIRQVIEKAISDTNAKYRAIVRFVITSAPKKAFL